MFYNIQIRQCFPICWRNVLQTKKKDSTGGKIFKKYRNPAMQAVSFPAEPQGNPKNTGVGSLSLLQQVFPTQELNWCLLHCRKILYQLSYQGSPYNIYNIFICISCVCVCVCVFSVTAVTSDSPWRYGLASLFIVFSKQDYWSGLPCPPPRDLSDPGIKLVSFVTPALAGRFFTTSDTWETHVMYICLLYAKWKK